jgi:hypothetical protein
MSQRRHIYDHAFKIAAFRVGLVAGDIDRVVYRHAISGPKKLQQIEGIAPPPDSRASNTHS